MENYFLTPTMQTTLTTPQSNDDKYMYVKDLTGKVYPCQLTYTTDIELNGNIVLSGTLYPSKVNKLFMDDLTEMWTITDFDDVEYKIIYASKRGEGTSLSINIRAIPLFFDELDTSRIYEEYNEHMPANVAFGRVFEDTDFTYALVDSFDAVQWEGFGAGESKLETFKRCLNRYQAEFKIVGHIVYLYKLVGRDTQFQYRHRLNASNIVKEIDATALYTYAKGYGNYQDGDDWQDAKLIREYTSPIAQIIGIRHAPPIKDGRVTNAGTMDRSLKALVDESLKISITADIHDLRKQGYPLAHPEVGDRVFVIDERINLLEEVRVTNISITKNWKNEVIDLNVTFGSEGVTKRHQSNLNTAIKDFTAIMNGEKKIPMTAYDNAVIVASESLKRMTSELVIPENGGLMAVDKDDPNNVVLFNAAGIGVSTDGGATFKNSITGQGVVAETIIGQSIIGVNLTSMDESGYFHVNGSDAEFVNLTNNKRVAISPDGLYGYNSGGTLRFQADSNRVTSALFGTNNGNVYLASMPNGELRVVNYDETGGGPNYQDHTYRPVRAKIFRFPDEDFGYFTLPGGGEFRFTGEDTLNPTFVPIRVGGVFTNDIESRGDILYLRTNNRVRSQLKGNSNVYAAFEGSDFIQSSSKEIKDNVNDFEECAIDIICDLRVVKFDYIDGDKNRIGVLAEESRSIGDGESVSLGNTTFLNTKAIQEIVDRLERLEKIERGN